MDKAPRPDADLDDADLAAILRALGHPVRLRILRILVSRAGECCCTEMTRSLDLAQSTVSQHLKVLLDTGIIVRQAEGTRNKYAVCARTLDALSGDLVGFIEGLEAGMGADRDRSRGA